MQKSDVRRETEVDSPNSNQHAKMTSKVSGRNEHPTTTGLDKKKGHGAREMYA